MSIEERLRAEADDVYGWSNGPGDRYARHSHAYPKILYCVSGSIDFSLDDRVIHLNSGDRMMLPAQTAHTATVGPEGCTCVEGKARSRAELMVKANGDPGLDCRPMTRPLSARMSRLGTETAFEVLAKARALEAQGRDIIHLEIGEPDFDTPPSIVQAGLSALQRGETHYTASAGIVELREAIANHLNRTRHLSVDPGQVIVTPGAKPIMFYAMLALLDAGDEAIYPDPGFPIYASMITFAGAKGVPLKLREKNDFNPDLDELKTLVTDRTKVIVLNSPENPTGGVLSQSVLKEIAQIARARDLWVLADEIYAEIMYEGTHHSIMREDGMAERTILLDGFSKTFAMTGWRLGYGVFPWPLVDPVTKLVTNSVSCTATFTQRAGAAALTNRPPEVAEMVKAFRERRDAVVTGLNKIDGITCREPKGAFYVFPNITGLGLGDSTTVQERILREAGIATLSGTAFGAGGEGHLRLSYANSLKNLQAAVTRIGEWAHVARQGRVAAAAGSITSADR